MPLSLRAKNLLLGGSLATFAASVFTYTVVQMNKVRIGHLRVVLYRTILTIASALATLQDDFDDLDDVVKVNVHQSGTIKATPIKKE